MATPALLLLLAVAAAALVVTLARRRRAPRRHELVRRRIAELERELGVGSYADALELGAAIARRRLLRAAERELDAAREEATRPRSGRPLRLAPRLARPQVETYLAAMSGPLPYMARLKESETRTSRHRDRLEDRWWETAERHADDPRGFEAAWRRLAARWSFHDVNELIAEHNRDYPIEANLPLDPATKDYVAATGSSYRREPLDADWVLTLFPPDVVAVRRALRAA